MISDDLKAYLSAMTFRGNQNLRPRDTQIPYTEEMINELLKCRQDPGYFITNYIKVVHPDRGLVNMELYDYQYRMIDTYHNNRMVCFLTARQQGKCCSINTLIKIRNKLTGKLVNLTIGEFYEWQKFNSVCTDENLQELQSRIRRSSQ